MDFASRIKNEPEAEEDIKIVMVKPAKSTLPSSVPSARQLHRNGDRQGGLDLFSVSRKPTPERETSVPLPPSIPPTPSPTQPITPATPAFDPTAFFNALTVWMQQQAQLQQQQLQQGLQPAAAAPAAVSHSELHAEIALRIEEMTEVDEGEKENEGGNEEMREIEETEEPSIDDELKTLLEGSSEEQKMQLLQFIRSGSGADGKVKPKRKGFARAAKEKKEENSISGNHKKQKKRGGENSGGRGRDRKLDVGNERKKLKKGNEGKDFAYWIGRTEAECCPQCGEFVALTGRRIHYIRYHYNLFYPITQQRICDVERWLGARIGRGGEGNRATTVDCRVCLHCKESKQ